MSDPGGCKLMKCTDMVNGVCQHEMMDFKKFDSETEYHFRKNMQEIAESLGYKSISEAIIKTYEKNSLYFVAEIFKQSSTSIRYKLKKWGVNIRQPHRPNVVEKMYRNLPCAARLHLERKRLSQILECSEYYVSYLRKKPMEG